MTKIPAYREEAALANIRCDAKYDYVKLVVRRGSPPTVGSDYRSALASRDDELRRTIEESKRTVASKKQAHGAKGNCGTWPPSDLSKAHVTSGERGRSLRH